MRVLTDNPEYEIESVYRWADWPERVAETGLDGRDIGIDLVARHGDGSWIAIQCKCYAPTARVGKGQIDSFLAVSQRPAFSMRWIVATCPWTRTAEAQIEGMSPPVRRIDFLRHGDDAVSEDVAARPVRDPWPLQAEAIADVVAGLENHDRGRLIMACGTGKTFTSLRIAERVVPSGGRILFLAPSIGLVSQARREWLRHTAARLDCRVVCSDRTAGGRGESNDIGMSELECAVTSDPEDIASVLSAESDKTRVVFCTYQSLHCVTQAQSDYDAPPFDLALMDEAHRTTGVTAVPGQAVESGFRTVHDADQLKTSSRLYMTATPRIYSASSKQALATKGIETVDMDDLDVYGPELHRLTFRQAVNAGILSDYRVIVLGVHEDAAPPGVRSQLVSLGERHEETSSRPLIVTDTDVTRLFGTSLAINGVTEGPEAERPGRLHRTIAFANSVARSSYYAEGMKLPELRKITTRRLRRADSDAAPSMPVESRHLDASDSALVRNQALRDLARAGNEGVARILFNVGLFGEGVDVPSLDAIVFIEPRQSQVDIVQAVGRVMRRSEGKRFGYIVVPVPIEPGADLAGALTEGTDGYQALGKVLRALAAHDGRLAEDSARFVQASVVGPGAGDGRDDDEGGQVLLDLSDASQGIYAHVVAASGLGKPGLQTSQDIEYAVRTSARLLQEGDLAADLAEALGLPAEAGARDISTIAALLLVNACLLHRRLSKTPGMERLPKLNEIGRARDVAAVLQSAWRAILERDYAPVFEPPLAVLEVLPPRRWVDHALRILAERANLVADSLSELGYDHSGPLYHRILPHGKSYGALYTKNLSALMLARLALGPQFCDWSDPKAVTALRIMDPACGTGTLLMAALHVIKSRVREAGGEGWDPATLHRELVENVLAGLDVNRTATQLAACNLTLGAPTVDYRRMNLLTLKHGPQPDGGVRTGSLEIVGTTDHEGSVQALIRPLRSMGGLAAEQVDHAEDVEFPLSGLDLVIMNPPFTNNKQRNRQFGAEVTERMQRRELGIRNDLMQRDPDAASVIDSNSIGTFFTPLADILLDGGRGCLATVVPATACTNTSGLAERQLRSRRFHIERIVTSHDPKRISFSEHTSIHECLLVARRWSGGEKPPTEFVSLRKMPSTPEEALAAADEILRGESHEWGRRIQWPSQLVEAGDWTPVQWWDGELAEVIRRIEASPHLEPIGQHWDIGPAGQGIRGAYRKCDMSAQGAARLFWSVSAQSRRTMYGEPEQWACPKGGKEELARRYWQRRSSVLVAMKHDTISGRLVALRTPEPSIGSGWVPVQVPDERVGKAVVAWWNSTPARLMLLNRRTRKLTYPSWSLDQLRQIQIPKPENHEAWDILAKAWEQASDMELLPIARAEVCRARQVIDEAASRVLGVTTDQVRDWRRRLASEPTVGNLPAEPRSDGGTTAGTPLLGTLARSESTTRKP
ncbi:MAG: DEAD/DEAH box helicase family protein [Gemmatimonadetes bacterium]|nr:DEAD/DEAH box helicase family protein [Gemmatimonadota bacterium]